MILECLYEGVHLNKQKTNLKFALRHGIDEWCSSLASRLRKLKDLMKVDSGFELRTDAVCEAKVGCG